MSCAWMTTGNAESGGRASSRAVARTRSALRGRASADFADHASGGS